MNKLVFTCAMVSLNIVHSMEKPPQPAAGIKDIKQSEFLKLVQGYPRRAMGMIEKGYVIDHAELYNLTSFSRAKHNYAEQYFWLHWGVEFLLNARLKKYGTVDSLRSLAAKKASKAIASDLDKESAYKKQFMMLPPELKSLVMDQDIQLIKRKWAELLKGLETKKPQFFFESLKQLSVTWKAVLENHNTLLGQKLLKKFIATVRKTKLYKDDPKIAAQVNMLINSLKQLLAEAQCDNAKNIVEYLRAKQLLGSFTDVIRKEFADAIRAARVTGSAGQYESDRTLILQLLSSDYNACLKSIRDRLDT